MEGAESDQMSAGVYVNEEQAKRDHELRMLQVRFRNWFAVFIVAGFFGVIILVLAFLDLTNSTITGFAGLIVGNVQGVAGMVISSIYQMRVSAQRQDSVLSNEIRRANDQKDAGRETRGAP